MTKRVLMVAYHFPPMNQSSGIQRTLRFAQYLPEYGWEPAVLTVHERAYSSVSQASMSEVPENLQVRRAFALDAGRHLSLRGVYPGWLALPDRWVSWWLGGVTAGLAMIRRLKPDVLWSTYPIATAHLIGYSLQRLTGIPWITDFRDPMAEFNEPTKAHLNKVLQWIEYRALKHCKRAVFAAPGALELYAERYPEIPRSRMVVIENGYDESVFARAEQTANAGAGRSGPLTLVHSGTIYAAARDPRGFFSALSEAQRAGSIGPDSLKVVLRATGCDDYVRELISRYGVHQIVTLEPSIAYQAALAEMLAADGLLLLQAANCNYQIPAKLYEYLRAKRPILALTDPAGDTAAVLRDAGIDTIAPLDSQDVIMRELMRFVDLIRLGTAPVAPAAKIATASRRYRTAELASLLDEVAG